MTTPTIKRPCHWLRRNRSSKRPEWLLFVDVEARQTELRPEAEIHTFRLGWAALCRYEPGSGLHVVGWHRILDPVSFWQRVTLWAYEQHQVYVISHNIDYDARVLRAFSILPGIGWTPDYFILSDSCRFWSFTADKHTISFLDNLNYWPFALEELGAEFGLPKAAVDFATVSDEELSAYCHRDVEILVRVWQEWMAFIDDQDLGDWAITLAGQAWNGYRHRFMPCRIGIHNRVDALELERRSYRGGRCEVWKLGSYSQGPYYKLDVNGLYAHCMAEYPSPLKLVKVLVDVRPLYLQKLLERYMVVADCLIETNLPLYAIDVGGYNVFPVGSFRAVLTTWDVQQALQHGHLRGIGQVAIYERQHLFRAYVRVFDELRNRHRDAGNNAQQLICKRFRNSLYGKFAQRGYSQSVIRDAPMDVVHCREWRDAETEQKALDWTFGGKVIRQIYSGEGPDSFPAISSHITAAGRVLLWDYCTKAGLDNVLYTDTDALIVNQAGYDNLHDWIDPTRLGYLKCEGCAPDLEIVARKSYIFGSDRTLKGIKKNALLTDSGLWEQTQFTTLRWGFRHGTLDDVVTTVIQKTERSEVFHGSVEQDGRVLPPELALDQDQVSALAWPQSDHAWTWWIDAPWYSQLEPRTRTPELPDWYVHALQDEPGELPAL